VNGEKRAQWEHLSSQKVIISSLSSDPDATHPESPHRGHQPGGTQRHEYHESYLRYHES